MVTTSNSWIHSCLWLIKKILWLAQQYLFFSCGKWKNIDALRNHWCSLSQFFLFRIFIHDSLSIITAKSIKVFSIVIKICQFSFILAMHRYLKIKLFFYQDLRNTYFLCAVNIFLPLIREYVIYFIVGEYCVLFFYFTNDSILLSKISKTIHCFFSIFLCMKVFPHFFYA